MRCLPAPREVVGKQTRSPAEQRPSNPALDALRADLRDDDALDAFLASYLSLLDQRIAEVARHIAEGRPEDCITVLLTIETSSAMVGAGELGLRAAALRLALGHRQPDTSVLYAELAQAGGRAHAELSAS